MHTRSTPHRNLFALPPLLRGAAFVALVFSGCGSAIAADDELTNYKSGIDVIWGKGDGSDKGVAYAEEYLFHDKLISDAKVVYIRSNTAIRMSHNARNNAQYPNALTGQGRFTTIGADGRDGIPNSGDEGVIRYKIDRDRGWGKVWAMNSAGTDAANVLPAYSAPFTLATQEFEPGIPVVGTTGWSNPSNLTSKTTYYRGMKDQFGDEWHVLAYADDDRKFLSALLASNDIFVDQAFYASDGKTVLLVVDPKTPCLTPRATGTGQFYTTPPKAYFTPKILSQTTYFSAGSNGTVTFELRDIFGHDVHYRINNGTWIDAGKSSVTLTQNDFNSGNNVLEYYYEGNEAFVKTRTVVKDPAFPSAKERHGFYLWGDAAGLTAAKARADREPYYGYYSGYKTRADKSAQDTWETNWRQGRRSVGGMPLENAFVALKEGWNYKRSGAPKTHGQYAKEMLLEGTRNVDPIGFELQHSADAIPNRELHYRGYYDALPVLRSAFAYDIMVANFRADQVPNGITAVEDYFVRDRLAGFAYEAMQWSAGMTSLGAPGMWGAARMMTGMMIGMIMPEYSTPYYGTSGFGSVQTTYPLCPFQDAALTWKAALFDPTTPKTSYPNLTWGIGLSDNRNEALFSEDGRKTIDATFPVGTWTDKAAYFSMGLMGIHLQAYANMVVQWGGGSIDPRLAIGFENASSGKFIGIKDPYPQTPTRFTLLLCLNNRFPKVVNNQLTWMRSLAPTDANSDDKLMQDAAIFGLAWYDDQVSPTITIAPPSDPKLEINVTP